VSDGGPAPEVRIDQLNGLRTILAAARSDRPFDYSPPSREAKAEESCPFCEGQEGRTPLETWADRPGGAANTPGWKVRAVPNLYPALAPPAEGDGGSRATDLGSEQPADPLRAAARGAQPDLFKAGEAKGLHEVIVHTPRHKTSMADLSDDELAAAVAGWRSRMRELDRFPCLQLIVNEGGGAGASLEHTHGQLYALSFVPVLVARERERFTAYNEQTMGGNLLGDIASEEVRRRDRLVAIDDEALLICPWASHGSFELRIVPRDPSARFEQDDRGAAMLATAMRALKARFGGIPEFNLWVRTAPRGTELFCWHIDIAPRLSQRAGFELSTGVDINIHPPERAAAELRESLN
jgi:UDPglucose--hexose-1-phosphate uridylyltransferase